MEIKKHDNGLYYAHLTGSVTVNLKTKNKAEAAKLASEARLQDIEFAKKAKLLNAETISKLSSGKIKCSEALDEWRAWAKSVGLSPNTLYQTETYLKMFFVQNGLMNKPVSSITEDHVDQFINNPEPIAASTRQYRLSAVKSFFTLSCARGYSLSNPAALVKVKMFLLSHEQKERKKVLPFTDRELSILHSLEDPFWRVATRLGYEAGLRIGDVAKLEWSSLNEKNRVIVWTDKHDRRVSVPISAELYKMLCGLPKEDDRFVFKQESQDALSARSRSKLSVYFGRLLEKHGIEGRGFHSLRHTFATKHRSLGKSVDEIRDMLGHRSSSTTNIYIHE